MSKTWLNLADKVVIVTGGASGIGKGVAMEYAEHGLLMLIQEDRLF